MSWVDEVEMERTAVISDDLQYRYELSRRWESEPEDVPVFAMLNPSTADGRSDDPTVLRCMTFARRWGWGGVALVNLYALRSSIPVTLRGHPDPVGPENDRWLRKLCGQAPFIVAAWGAHPLAADRAAHVIREGILPADKLYCLGITDDGHPRHPLARGRHRVPDDTDPKPYQGQRYLLRARP